MTSKIAIVNRTLIGVGLVLLAAKLLLAESNRPDSKGTSFHRLAALMETDGDRLHPFKLQAIGEQEDHIVGVATYRDKSGRAAQKTPGIRTADGRFWPTVVAEVSNDIAGPWKQLKQVVIKGEPTVFTLSFYRPNVTLYISLDAFRPLIGKMRYGRVVLTNGEEAVFDLRSLLPPSDPVSHSNASDWYRDTLYGYLEDPMANPPFAIAAASSKDGHLRVVGGYFEADGDAPASITGTKGPEGEFWACATLQVANDPDGKWKTVCGVPSSGERITLTIQPKDSNTILNVDVDALQKCIGSFGYARVILSNGKSAIFELTYLLPPTIAN